MKGADKMYQATVERSEYVIMSIIFIIFGFFFLSVTDDFFPLQNIGF